MIRLPISVLAERQDIRVGTGKVLGGEALVFGEAFDSPAFRRCSSTLATGSDESEEDDYEEQDREDRPWRFKALRHAGFLQLPIGTLDDGSLHCRSRSHSAPVTRLADLKRNVTRSSRLTPRACRSCPRALESRRRSTSPSKHPGHSRRWPRPVREWLLPPRMP